MGNSIRNIVIAILALWSVISVIVMVVWATTPQMSDIKQCQAVVLKLEGEKVGFSQNQQALEEMVVLGRRNQTRLRGEIAQLLTERHNATAALGVCRDENVILNGNITVLEKQIDAHKEMEANLTFEITLHQESIETLQKNLTEASDLMECYRTMKSAAERRKLAAEKETKDCESSKLLLQKHLQNCMKENPPATSEQVDDGCATPKNSILAIALVLCTSLHLITCK